MVFKQFVIFFIIIICFGNINAANNKKKLGVMVTKLEPCPNPAHKMLKNNPVSVHTSLRITGNRSSAIDVNINNTRTFGPVFVSLRVFQIQKVDKRKQIYKVDDASCRHPLTFQLMRIYKAPIDKNCMVEKAVVWVKDLDLDKFSWLLTKAAATPGKYVYEIEYTSGNSCVYCSKIICELFYKN